MSKKYDHLTIEPKWQQYWDENKTFKVDLDPDKPKYYILDMFPYPSGDGLHVGHPLGYTATDILARYKRMRGFNVLHPMGWDAFGLPAEQYAIKTGTHPSKTTRENVKNFKRQIKMLGFSYDWDREINTTDPEYYKWTQWIFIQLFDSYYCKIDDAASPISELIEEFERNGNANVKSTCDDDTPAFNAQEWNACNEKEKQDILLKYRLAYLAESEVNWCPELGTVLANDEIVNGVSERGGHKIEKRLMLQWNMRISAYADRLLNDLENIDWSNSIKETQRNWIGKSIGVSMKFNVIDHDENIKVFTTRPDTIFGVSFMTLAPEHQLVLKICTDNQRKEVEEYIELALSLIHI